MKLNIYISGVAFYRNSEVLYVSGKLANHYITQDTIIIDKTTQLRLIVPKTKENLDLAKFWVDNERHCFSFDFDLSTKVAFQGKYDTELKFEVKNFEKNTELPSQPARKYN